MQFHYRQLRFTRERTQLCGMNCSSFETRPDPAIPGEDECDPADGRQPGSGRGVLAAVCAEAVAGITASEPQPRRRRRLSQRRPPR
jgi:hypothetical protein